MAEVTEIAWDTCFQYGKEMSRNRTPDSVGKGERGERGLSIPNDRAIAKESDRAQLAFALKGGRCDGNHTAYEPVGSQGRVIGSLVEVTFGLVDGLERRNVVL